MGSLNKFISNCAFHSIMSFENKINLKENPNPSQLDKELARILTDLEASNIDIRSELSTLMFNRVKEIIVELNKKAVIIFIPFRLRKQFKKIQVRLIRELSKKFGSKDILIITDRVILPRSYVRRKGNQQRPRSRTLTNVHQNILEDICYPINIIGKRTRITQDGRRLIKIILDLKHSKDYEEKCNTFTAAYKNLCNKTAEFFFATV